MKKISLFIVILKLICLNLTAQNISITDTIYDDHEFRYYTYPIKISHQLLKTIHQENYKKFEKIVNKSSVGGQGFEELFKKICIKNKISDSFDFKPDYLRVIRNRTQGDNKIQSLQIIYLIKDAIISFDFVVIESSKRKKKYRLFAIFYRDPEQDNELKRRISEIETSW